MLEILQYIFSDFWHWLGTVILIAVIPMPFRFVIRNKKEKSENNPKENRI